MIKSLLQRGLVTFMTIDALLIVAAGSALAAPARALPETAPSLPTLLLLGVGTVAVGMGWRRRH